MNHASMEFDEPYIPKNRSDLKLPAGDTDIDYEEYFGDTPIYTLFILVRQQLLAFPAYLCMNHHLGFVSVAYIVSESSV